MRAAERRKHARVRVELPLRLTFKDRTVESMILDMSSSGIRFHAPEPLPLLNRVQIALELPDSPEPGKSLPLSITGVVVRCAEVRGKQKLPYETAIFFEDISPSARARLARFMSSRPA
ncbi:MAG: PilZ domain-containing protein [Planctomycetaceae bacterium]